MHLIWHLLTIIRYYSDFNEQKEALTQSDCLIPFRRRPSSGSATPRSFSAVAAAAAAAWTL